MNTASLDYQLEQARADRLSVALRSLNAAQRQIIARSELCGKELAAQLGGTEVLARQRRKRALDALRRAYGDTKECDRALEEAHDRNWEWTEPDRLDLLPVNAAAEQLQLSRTRLIAERLEGALCKPTAIVESMANTIENTTLIWGQEVDRKARLQRWLATCVQSYEWIYGSCLAFEPGQYDHRDEFAIYAYRPGGGLKMKELATSGYMPYRKWRWYSKPIALNQVVLSEPFFDQGGGDIEMVTISIPFRRESKLAGVVTLDIPRERFSEVAVWIQEAGFGPSAYPIVVSEEGSVIYHPQSIHPRGNCSTKSSEYQMPTCFLNEGTGLGIDPVLRTPATFCVVRLRSIPWRVMVADPRSICSL